MTHKRFGSAAFVFATGLLLFTAAPSRATETADGSAAAETSEIAGKPLALTKTTKARSATASRARKAAKIAAVQAGKRKALAAKQARAERARPAAEPLMSETVANARAQMPGADARGEASVTETAPLEAAAAEQLDELSKSLTTPDAPTQPTQMAQYAADEPTQLALPAVAPEEPRPQAQARAAASTDAWAQSSLIGKIFIAFGGMLTLASAARMLVA